MDTWERKSLDRYPIRSGRSGSGSFGWRVLARSAGANTRAHRLGPRAKRAAVSLALPSVCGSCGGKWETKFRTEKGLKCEKLEASLRCGACGERRSVSFCLPEMG